MLMSDKDIREAMKSGDIVIDGFFKQGLQGCSYDARLGDQALISNKDDLINVAAKGSLTLEPGGFALLITCERFELAGNVAGHIGMKSAMARRGVILLAGIQIDPTFKGHLRLGVYNASPRRITLDYKEEICTIEFHRLQHLAEKIMPDFPELQDGRIPANDKAFLRAIETTSLTEMQRTLRELTRDVGTIARQLKTMTNLFYPTLIGIVLIILGGLFNFMFIGHK